MPSSLDIIAAEVFALLEAGTEPLEPSREGRGARPGSENRAEVQDGSSRNLGDLVVVVCNAGSVAGHQQTRLAREEAPGARERTRGQHPGPEREPISAREPTARSRSAFMVPETSGNSAREDPIEGRGAPCVQSRDWETRRAP
jgi:hypothetical protein